MSKPSQNLTNQLLVQIQTVKENLTAIQTFHLTASSWLSEIQKQSDELIQIREAIRVNRTHLEDLQEQKQSLKSNFEAETAKLLAKREKILADKLKDTEIQINTATKRFADTLDSLGTVKKELFETQALLEAATHDLDVANKAVATSQKRKTSLENDQTTLVESIKTFKKQQKDALTEFNDQINGAKTEIVELNGQITTLRDQKDAYYKENQEDQAHYKELKERRDNEIKTLEARKIALENKMREDEAQNEFVRKDLARRQRVIDDKEAVLKRREMIVQQDEQQIANNANLLNL